MSARRSAGRVVDAVAGHRHHLALRAAARRRCAAWPRVSCGRRSARGPSREQPRRARRSFIASSSVAGDDGRRRRATMPTCRAIAAAVSPWSPVTTMIRIPARWQRVDRVGDLGPRRVEHRDQAEQAVRLGLGLLARARGTPSSVAPGDARAPAAPARRSRRPAVEPLAPAVVERPLAVGVQDASQRAAPPRARPWRARTSPVARGRRRSTSARSAGSKWNRLPAPRRAPLGRDVGAQAAGGERAGRSRSGRRCARRRPRQLGVGARAAASSSAERALAEARRAGSVGLLEVDVAAPARIRSVTRIRFSVSVPVLSVQITVVEPERLDGAQPLDQRAPRGRAPRTPTPAPA